MTLNIPADLEQALRQTAAVQGKDPVELGLAAIDHFVRPDPSALPWDESELLQIVNRGFPEEWWDRYHALIQKRRAESISEQELTELIQRTDQLEVYGARRLEALVQLAKIRGVTLESLMEELQIHPHLVE